MPKKKSARLSQNNPRQAQNQEFDRGYNQAMNAQESRPTSLDYVRGFEKGRRTLELRNQTRHAPSSPKYTDSSRPPIQGAIHRSRLCGDIESAYTEIGIDGQWWLPK